MARKKHSPEQIVALLRQIEVAIANQKTSPHRPAEKPGSKNRPTTAGARSTAA